MTMPRGSRSTSVAPAKVRRPPHPLRRPKQRESGKYHRCTSEIPLCHVGTIPPKHGPVYREPASSSRCAASLCSEPEADELVLFDRDKNFSSSTGWYSSSIGYFPAG